MGRLNGKVAIITGAAQGMGEATARLFASEGAKVVLCDVSVDKGEAVAKDIGSNAIFQKLDVTSDSEWSDAVKAATDKFGSIDILVNNLDQVETDLDDAKERFVSVETESDELDQELIDGLAFLENAYRDLDESQKGLPELKLLILELNSNISYRLVEF